MNFTARLPNGVSIGSGNICVMFSGSPCCLPMFICGISTAIPPFYPRQNSCRPRRRGAGLRASDGARMVRRGFRALKTPERASSLPTLQRRLTDAALRMHSYCGNTATETDLLQKSCRNTAYRLHLSCVSAFVAATAGGCYRDFAEAPRDLNGTSPAGRNPFSTPQVAFLSRSSHRAGDSSRCVFVVHQDADNRDPLALTLT